MAPIKTYEQSARKRKQDDKFKKTFKKKPEKNYIGIERKEDIFDKIRTGEIYNQVNITNNFKAYNSSGSIYISKSNCELNSISLIAVNSPNEKKVTNKRGKRKQRKLTVSKNPVKSIKSILDKVKETHQQENSFLNYSNIFREKIVQSSTPFLPINNKCSRKTAHFHGFSHEESALLISDEQFSPLKVTNNETPVKHPNFINSRRRKLRHSLHNNDEIATTKPISIERKSEPSNINKSNTILLDSTIETAQDKNFYQKWSHLKSTCDENADPSIILPDNKCLKENLSPLQDKRQLEIVDSVTGFKRSEQFSNSSSERKTRSGKIYNVTANLSNNSFLSGEIGNSDLLESKKSFTQTSKSFNKGENFNDLEVLSENSVSKELSVESSVSVHENNSVSVFFENNGVINESSSNSNDAIKKSDEYITLRNRKVILRQSHNSKQSTSRDSSSTSFSEVSTKNVPNSEIISVDQQIINEPRKELKILLEPCKFSNILNKFDDNSSHSSVLEDNESILVNNSVSKETQIVNIKQPIILLEKQVDFKIVDENISVVHDTNNFESSICTESQTNVLLMPDKSVNILDESKDNSKSSLVLHNTSNELNESDIKEPINLTEKNRSTINTSADLFTENISHNNISPDLMEKDKTIDSISSLDGIEKSSYVEEDNFKKPLPLKRFQLKPGKSWRRSLNEFKINSSVSETNRKSCYFIIPVALQTLKENTSILEDYSNNSCYVTEQQENFIEKQLDLEDTFRSLSLNHSTVFIDKPLNTVTAKEIVLRRCGQTEPLPFEECYPPSLLKNCQKIGEGIFGEVFLFRNPNGGTTVMKIVPIEGNQFINGEKQKKFEEILSEILISMELSNLRYTTTNTAENFTEVKNVKCVIGTYPERLIDLWELYYETKISENDSPAIFTSEQLYIVLELANGGVDLEAFNFNNSLQAYSMFQQVACALAVAESQLNFEHRDLHWGNVLLANTNTKKISFSLDNEIVEINTYGIVATIIDFTLSRIEYDGVVIFNNLALDPDLFLGEGDYQFDIYRLMQEKNGDDWQHFEPYTNVLWLHYILEKAITGLRYKNKKSKVHNEYLEKIVYYKENILKCDSAKDFVLTYFI